MVMAGFTYSCEYVVLILLRGYKYTPGLLQDRFRDGMIGAISSNAFVIPSVSVVAAAFHLSWPWIIVVAGAVTGIELWFLYLGIFEHYWWRTLFTTAGAALWCFVAQFAYRWLRSRKQGCSPCFMRGCSSTHPAFSSSLACSTHTAFKSGGLRTQGRMLRHFPVLFALMASD